MLGFDNALDRLKGAVSKLDSEYCPLDEAAGRILAEPIIARIDSPRCHVSAMDGYAIADATTRLGDKLELIGTSYAGAGFAGSVGRGQTVRIFTGAPMPEGADRVIMQENIDLEGGQASVARAYGPGWHVRPRASDFAAGDLLLAEGSLLTPRAILAAGAADRSDILVTRRPALAIIGTGDEIVEPGTALKRPEAIPDSVSFGVAAYARSLGANILSRRRIADRLDVLERAAIDALTAADLVVVTGGASVGERDYAKTMFAPHGLEFLFSKVAIKPGKPVWLARAGKTYILGLPGNPTSAMVTARLFLAPLLAKLQGQSSPDPLRWRPLPLAKAIKANGSRETFVRAFWSDDGLMPLDDQSSAAQHALTQADWLIRRAPDCAEQEPGSLVYAIEF